MRPKFALLHACVRVRACVVHASVCVCERQYLINFFEFLREIRCRNIGCENDFNTVERFKIVESVRFRFITLKTNFSRREEYLFKNYGGFGESRSTNFRRE